MPCWNNQRLLYIAACSAACAADLTSASATELWSHFLAVVLTYVPNVMEMRLLDCSIFSFI